MIIKKESLKEVLEALKKKGHKNDEKTERLVLNLALQRIDSDSYRHDGEAVYTGDGKYIVYCMSQSDSFAMQAGTEVIGEMAFRGKRYLKNVVFADSTRRIERQAFYDCDELQTVCLPAGVKEIKGYAFADCDKLTKVTFAAVPEKLSRHAFDDCEQLREIFIPEGSTEFFAKALYYDEIESEYTFKEVKREKKGPAKKASAAKKNEAVEKRPAATDENGQAAKTEDTPKKEKPND